MGDKEDTIFIWEWFVEMNLEEEIMHSLFEGLKYEVPKHA